MEAPAPQYNAVLLNFGDDNYYLAQEAEEAAAMDLNNNATNGSDEEQYIDLEIEQEDEEVFEYLVEEPMNEATVGLRRLEIGNEMPQEGPRLYCLLEPVSEGAEANGSRGQNGHQQQLFEFGRESSDMFYMFEPSREPEEGQQREQAPFDIGWGNGGMFPNFQPSYSQRSGPELATNSQDNGDFFQNFQPSYPWNNEPFSMGNGPQASASAAATATTTNPHGNRETLAVQPRPRSPRTSQTEELPQPNTEEGDSRNGAKGPHFPCPFCMRVVYFENEVELRSHIAREHVRPHEPEMCPSCFIMFPDRLVLKSHIEREHWGLY